MEILQLWTAFASVAEKLNTDYVLPAVLIKRGNKSLNIERFV